MKANMNCPKCDVGLDIEQHKGIEIDRCPRCEGLWLDHVELDQLEDTAFDKDELKGMMEYNPRASEIDCPVCGARMTTFNYRAYNLPIDTCKEEHGYWLDKGEDKRVIEIMKQRIKDLDRKSKAEAQWYGFLSKLGRKKGGLFG